MYTSTCTSTQIGLQAVTQEWQSTRTEARMQGSRHGSMQAIREVGHQVCAQLVNEYDNQQSRRQVDQHTNVQTKNMTVTSALSFSTALLFDKTCSLFKSFAQERVAPVGAHRCSRTGAGITVSRHFSAEVVRRYKKQNKTESSKSSKSSCPLILMIFSLGHMPRLARDEFQNHQPKLIRESSANRQVVF